MLNLGTKCYVRYDINPKLMNNEMAGIRVPLPKVEEQENISQYLDRKTAQIDALIAQKERMIELLKEERTAIINQAVTKGLDPNVEMKDSGIEWLGKVPKHWQMKRLKYLVSLVNQPIEETTGTELRIDLEDLESWTGETIEIESQNKNIEGMKSFASGDVLFNKLRPYLAKCIEQKFWCLWWGTPGSASNHIARFRFSFLSDSSSAFINVVDG